MGVWRKQSTPNFQKKWPSLTPCAQGVRNVRFSENLAYFVFFKHPFWDSPFCLITGDITWCISKLFGKYIEEGFIVLHLNIRIIKKNFDNFKLLKFKILIAFFVAWMGDENAVDFYYELLRYKIHLCQSLFFNKVGLQLY